MAVTTFTSEDLTPTHRSDITSLADRLANKGTPEHQAIFNIYINYYVKRINNWVNKSGGLLTSSAFVTEVVEAENKIEKNSQDSPQDIAQKILYVLS